MSNGVGKKGQQQQHQLNGNTSDKGNAQALGGSNCWGEEKRNCTIVDRILQLLFQV